MKTIFGAVVMTLGVVLLSWNLYCIYHHVPMSAPAFGAGMIFALVGAGWAQGKSSHTI